MEKVNSTSQMEFNVVLKLTEQEASALHAITVYGSKEFLNTFYEKLGKSYLEPFSSGLVSLFDNINKELPKHLTKFKNTRKIWAEQVLSEINKRK